MNDSLTQSEVKKRKPIGKRGGVDGWKMVNATQQPCSMEAAGLQLNTHSASSSQGSLSVPIPPEKSNSRCKGETLAGGER